MEKIIYQDDYEELFRLCDGQMNTLILPGVKFASSFSADDLSRYAPDKDHFLQHVVAMGATESYGPNKNADGFKRATLMTSHPTFVKNGCFFREHRNRCQKTQGIGQIKASTYNKDMDRVELLVWGNIKKAEEEYELAKSGKPLSYSMSCKIAGDICNCCGNFAKTRANYCDHMKYHANQYLPEFQKYAFVDNPDPTFFDISRVAKPADRIAHYLAYAFPDEKAASFDRPILGIDWAAYEGVKLAHDDTDAVVQNILRKLVAEESYVSNRVFEKAATDARAQFYNQICKHAFYGQLTDAELDVIRNIRPGTLFRKFATHGVILPFQSFIAYVEGRRIADVMDDDNVKYAACSCMGDMFKNLASSGILSALNMFDAGSHGMTENDAGCDDVVDEAMERVAERFSCNVEPVKSRVIAITIKGASQNRKPLLPRDTHKVDVKKAEALSSLYAHYKIATLKNMVDIGHDVDEPLCLLAVSSSLC
jgi:hypothetical protein